MLLETSRAGYLAAIGTSAYSLVSMVQRFGRCNRYGEFNEAGVTLGAGHTIASIRQGLRQRGVFLKKVMAA